MTAGDLLPREPVGARRGDAGTARCPPRRIGKTANVTSASSRSRKSRIAAVPTSVSVAEKSVTMPSVTSWSSAWTSLVRREIRTPGLVARVEADRERLEVGEDPRAQVLQRALADPVDEVGLRVGGAPSSDRARARKATRITVSAPVSARGCRRRSRGRRGRAGRATRAVPSSSATNISVTRPAVGAQQREQLAQLARAAALAAQRSSSRPRERALTGPPPRARSACG